MGVPECFSVNGGGGGGGKCETYLPVQHKLIPFHNCV